MYETKTYEFMPVKRFSFYTAYVYLTWLCIAMDCIFISLYLRNIRCTMLAKTSVVINVNYLVSYSINFGSSPKRCDALTQKLLLTYFADICSLPLLLLVQSNGRIPGNLKDKIHRTSFSRKAASKFH